MKFKTTRFRSTWGDTVVTIHSIQGLPEGVACYWAPEEERRPAGESYVVKKRGGRKTVRRFRSAAQAKSHAMEWAEAQARPAKRKAVR